MRLIGSIIYGFVSGLTEIFPVSSQANQMVMRQLFGIAQKEPIRDLLVHIAVIAALFAACHGLFTRIRREQVLAHRMRRNPSQVHALKGVYDMRLIRSAAPVMIIGLFANLFFSQFYHNRPMFSTMLLVNAALTLIPVYMHQGNKDARVMAGSDGILIGFAAAFSAIPGISRNGVIMSIALMRGAQKENGLTWAMLLSVPALVVLILLDFISMFTIGVGTLTLAIAGGYLVSMAFAFVGAYLAVILLRTLVRNADFSGFAFYDIGLSMLAFALYLLV